MKKSQETQTVKEEGIGNSRLLSAEDVAEMLGISAKAVSQLAGEGKLACVQLTRRERRFTTEQVEEFIVARTVHQEPEPQIATGDRKKQAYNCLGSLSWMIDAFLVWAKEMIDMGGDYAPGPEIRKASKEELEDYVRRTRCQIRLMQAAVDAARHYQKLDRGIDEEGLAELHDEAWSLYRSLEGLIHELGNENLDLVTMEHPALKYLAGPAFEAMSYTCFKIERDFHETIIPRKEG